MNLKKIIGLVAGLGLLVALGIYANSLINKSGKSDTELIEFSIKDINTVDRVVITDKLGYTFELIKSDSVWTGKNNECIPQENIQFILEAFRDIEFKGYLPKNSIDNNLKMMAAQHIKVEIYQDGDWTKTWYIGPSTPDHYGQIMLLDSDEGGKSDYPVIMKIKNLSGMIEPRFYGDARKWACTQVFGLEMEEIQKVEVTYHDFKARSFTVNRKGNEFEVFQEATKLEGVDEKMVFRYLQNYNNIHYNIVNFELSKRQVDSLKKTQPFADLKLTEKNHNVTSLRMFRIKADQPQENEFGEITDNDGNNFWCELSNGELVKCQYYAFNPILFGHVYFPLKIDKDVLPGLSQDIK